MDVGVVGRMRQPVVGERADEKLSVRIVCKVLAEHRAEPLDDGAQHLGDASDDVAGHGGFFLVLRGIRALRRPR